jgi:hypothetical protein
MELVRSQTNSANDSSGSVWGLPGNTFIAVVVSLVLSVGVMVVLMARGANSYMSMVAACIPSGLTVGYLAAFVIGRPKDYAIDLVDLLVTGKGFSMHPLSQPKHPLSVVQYDHINRSKRLFR